MLRVLHATCLMLAVIACAPFAPGSLVVPLASNEWGEFALHVYDASGFVVSGRAAEPRPTNGTDEVFAVPERREVEIAWTGGACSHRPTLVVTGNSLGLRLVVRNPHDETLLPISCPSVGIALRVVLSLNQAVAQDAITLEVDP